MKVTATIEVSLESILNGTPEGQLAMFEVTSIPSSAEDWILGEHVYVHRNKVWDCITDECHGLVELFGLRFVRYIDR